MYRYMRHICFCWAVFIWQLFAACTNLFQLRVSWILIITVRSIRNNKRLLSKNGFKFKLNMKEEISFFVCSKWFVSHENVEGDLFGIIATQMEIIWNSLKMILFAVIYEILVGYLVKCSYTIPYGYIQHMTHDQHYQVLTVKHKWN